MCITDAGLIQRVEYILADYEPITFLQPAINDTELPYKNNYNIPCTAMGHPQPQLSWLKIDDADNTEIKLIFQSGYIEVVKEQASLILRFPTYFGFIQHGKFACRANNVWESSTQVIRLPQLPVTPPPAGKMFAITHSFYNPINSCEARCFAVIETSNHKHVNFAIYDHYTPSAYTVCSELLIRFALGTHTHSQFS